MGRVTAALHGATGAGWSVPATRAGLRVWMLMLLVVAIGTMPRIPLPLSIPARTFDLRAEDLLLALCAVLWGLQLLVRARINVTPLAAPLVAYVLVAVVTTAVNTFVTPENLLRSSLYLLKELEYFFIFFLVANWAREERDLQRLQGVVLLVGVANLIWAAVQLATGTTRQLFLVSVPEDVYVSPGRLAHYGIVMLGESSPLSVGAFLALVSFLAYSMALFRSRRRERWLYLGLGMAFSIASILVGIKLSIVFLAVGVLVLTILAGRRIVSLIIGMVAVTVLAFTLASAGGWMTEGKLADVQRVFYWDSYIGSISGDRALRWRALLSQGWDAALVGRGKGSLLYLPEEDALIDEAHNHYLRVFLDAGIFGVLTFLWLLTSAGRMSLSLFRRSRSEPGRITGAAALCALLALATGALAQDSFRPVIPNALLWAFMGLTAAACRITVGERRPTPLPEVRLPAASASMPGSA